MLISTTIKKKDRMQINIKRKNDAMFRKREGKLFFVKKRKTKTVVGQRNSIM